MVAFVTEALEDLIERGWLLGDERLSVTEAGREHLRGRMWGTRGEMHRLFAGGGVHSRGWRPSVDVDGGSQNGD
jgi:hypothetical protein